jgi:hypothetical protein
MYLSLIFVSIFVYLFLYPKLSLSLSFYSKLNLSLSLSLYPRYYFRCYLPFIAVVVFVGTFLAAYFTANNDDAYAFFGSVLSVVSGLLVLLSFWQVSPTAHVIHTY